MNNRRCIKDTEEIGDILHVGGLDTWPATAGIEN